MGRPRRTTGLQRAVGVGVASDCASNLRRAGQCFYYENVGTLATVEQLKQQYVLCARDVKDPTLVHLIHDFIENKPGQVIVFTNKCR